MNSLTEETFPEFVNTFEELGMIHEQLKNPVALAQQLKTLLKFRHDTWLENLTQELSDKGFAVTKEPIWNDLTPDLIFSVEQDSVQVLELSFSMNKEIIDKKITKYTSLINSSREVFHFVGFDTVFETKFSLNRCLDWKLKFISVTERVINKFLKQVELCGCTKSVLAEINELHYLGMYKEDYNIHFSKKMRNAIDYLPRDSRESLPIQEKINIIATTIKEILETNDKVNTLYSLEVMESGNYSASFDKCKKNILTSFQQQTVPKPSFLFYSPIEVDNPALKGKPWKTEQDLISLQIKLLSKSDMPLSSLFSSFQSLLNHKETRNVFNMSVPVATQNEPTMRSKYQSYYKEIIASRKDGEDSKIDTFIDFCLLDAGVKNCVVNSKTRKTLTVVDNLDDVCMNEIKKSKTNMSKSEYLKQKLDKSSRIKSGLYKLPCFNPDTYNFEIERYIKTLIVEVDKQIPEEIFRMLYKPGKDAPMFEQLKEQALSDFRIFLNCLRFTPLLSNMVDITRHLNQLLHFQNLTFKHNNFSVFNSGIPNLLYLVQHGIQDRGKDVGRSFMIIKFGEIADVEASLYGFHNTYKLSDGVTSVHCTKWRRLNSQRIGFHLDQIYSVLSTTFASFQRRLSESRVSNLDLDLVFAETKVIFAVRYLVSISHRQLFAEMLSDIRYLYMDAFSEFADCQQFILDKYTKPVQTHFECFLLNLIPKFEKFRQEFLKTGVTFKSASFVGKQREQYSIGGKINLPSMLYPGVRIRSIQDLLDDMFLYVHTNKDPSTPYHEYVKAFKTILKYQEKYDNLKYNRKKGLLLTKVDVEDFLETDNGVGFWGLATNTGAELISERLNVNVVKSKINAIIRDDTILDMNSTKSIIPERKREAIISEYDETFVSQFKGETRNIRKKQRELWEHIDHSDLNPYSFKIITKKKEEKDKLIVVSGTNRCKVHDSTKDILETSKIRTTLEFALWNINHNNSRVVTDICIKAQYGAKREFYVINHGAKAMARILEQTFKVICTNLEEEMISVSGDKKMYNIQNLLDRALLNTTGDEKKIYYCNGDCTKWSAAETMECLLKFTQGFSNIIDQDLMLLLEEIIMAWANKEVFIPTDLLKNVYFNIPGVTEKLKETTFKSTQNFLQGMFNYLSSSKAMACSELTREVWKTLYPDDTSEFYHMEHSDDYAFIFVTEKAETFALFKKIHRIIMRFMGISDSTKKTNCQQFLLEFISLISFNGVMVYPQIKKIKEVGLNIGCLGYASDIMTTCSRVGEACRMGVPADVAYIMGRVQNIRIASAYGLFTTNKHLYYNKDYKNLSWTSIPVQLWGVPDVHPMFYLFSKGDPNNYRLYKYEQRSKPLLHMLYLLSKCENLVDKEEYQEDRTRLSTGLFHPNYSYLRNSSLLKNIRKRLDFSLEDSRQYWDDHPLDLLSKPRSPDRFKSWVLSKYYQKSFGEAYMRQGRVQLMLRLSHFVKQKCLTLNLDVEQVAKYFDEESVSLVKSKADDELSISDTADLLFKLSNGCKLQHISDKLFLPSLYGYDQVSSYIYTHFSIASYKIMGKSNRDTKAYPEPSRKFEYSCVNDPSKVLQYIVSPDDFYKDNMSMKDIPTFLNDKSILTSLAVSLDMTPTNLTIKDINIISEIATTSRGGGKPLLLNFNPMNDLLTSITKYVETQSISGRYCVVETGLYEEFTPRSEDTMFETQLYTMQHPLHTGWEMETPELLNDVTMIMALCVSIDIPSSEARKVMKSMILDIDKSVHSNDYIRKIADMYLSDQLKLTNQQVQMVCALSDFVLNDPLPLMKYLDTKLGYKYEYRKNSPKKGLTTIYLQTLGESFKLIFNETQGKPGHNLTIITETKKLQIIPLAYLTGLRLMGTISVGEFLKRTNKDLKQYLETHNPVTSDNVGKQLYMNKFSGQFSFSQNPNVDVKLPVFIVDKLDMVIPRSGDDIHNLLMFDYNNLSAYSGKAKVFTLPVKNLVQFNCWSAAGSIGEFPLNFVLKNNILSKTFKNDYQVDSDAFFSQYCKDDIIEHSVKSRTKTRFRLYDADIIEKNKIELNLKLKKQQQQLNPSQYGFGQNIYFEDVMELDTRTATDYMFGTSHYVDSNANKTPMEKLSILDDVLDAEFELNEDILFEGVMGDGNSTLLTFSSQIMKESQLLYEFVRHFLREEEFDGSMLLSKINFITDNVNTDIDIKDSRYKGLGVDRYRLCQYVENGGNIETFKELIKPKEILAPTTESKGHILDLDMDDMFDIDVEVSDNFAERSRSSSSSSMIIDQKKNVLDLSDDDLFDIDIDIQEEEKVSPNIPMAGITGTSLLDDIDFDDIDICTQPESVENAEMEEGKGKKEKMEERTDEEKAQSSFSNKNTILDLDFDDMFDIDVEPEPIISTEIVLEENILEHLPKPKPSLSCLDMDFDDDTFDIDVIQEYEEEETKEDISSNPTNYIELENKEYIYTLDGIFENPRAFLDSIKQTTPINAVETICPGDSGIFDLLRILKKTYPEEALRMFPKFMMRHRFANNEIKLNEHAIIDHFAKLGLYNISSDFNFKFHPDRKPCNCVRICSNYREKGSKICDLLTIYGRSLLICEFFFTHDVAAIDFFNNIIDNCGHDLLFRVLRLDVLNKGITNDWEGLVRWIDQRFEKPTVNLMEDEINIDIIKTVDDTFIPEFEFDIDDDEIEVIQQTTTQKHPMSITTTDIHHEPTKISFMDRKPYTVLQLKESVKNFPLKALEFKYLGDCKFKSLNNFSRLTVLTVLTKMSETMNRKTLEWKYFNKFLKDCDDFIFPNTARHKLPNNYFHCIRENKSIIFKHIHLQLKTFENMIKKLSEIENVEFVYNPDDSVDVYTPTNEKDISVCNEQNLLDLLNDLGRYCEIGKTIMVIQEESEYDEFLDEVL
jgi:hypothetical protein